MKRAEHELTDMGEVARALYAEAQRGTAGNGLAAGAASPEQHDAELSSALVIRQFLDGAEVAQVHEAGTAAIARQAVAQPCERTGAMELAQRFGMGSRTHTVGFMHRDGEFLRGWPELGAKLVRGMQSHGIEEWGAVVPSLRQPLHTRCIEYHRYETGGGLVCAGHRDAGSALTMAVLLSDPLEDGVEGGVFVTYTGGEPVAHEMARGDAILFRSEKCHNVTTVRKGLRSSLVVELWTQPNHNTFDRFS